MGAGVLRVAPHEVVDEAVGRLDPRARGGLVVGGGGGQLAAVPVKPGLLQLREPVLDADAERLGQRRDRSTKTDRRIVSYTSTRQPRATAVTAASGGRATARSSAVKPLSASHFGRPP